MSVRELVDTIVRLEWADFSQVQGIDGPAECQHRPDMFTAMRRSLLLTWSEELLESYLEDVRNAQATGRSLMSEKYAWMMESTDARAFEGLGPLLPTPSYETCERIERIFRFFLVWQAQANVMFPRMTAGGRPLLADDDRPGLTSFETYLRSELKIYSPRTVRIYEEYARTCWQNGVNLAVENLNNIARQYGYEDAFDAERRSS